MHHRRVKTDQLGRAWKDEAVPIPPSSSSSSSVSQGRSLGSGGQFNQERTVTVGTSALQKQKVHCNHPVMAAPPPPPTQPLLCTPTSVNIVILKYKFMFFLER